MKNLIQLLSLVFLLLVMVSCNQKTEINSTGNYKEEIRQTEHQFYDHPVYRQAIVDWEPDFIEVSATGDLGYSYGKYLWQIKDSTGRISEYKGVYMTI